MASGCSSVTTAVPITVKRNKWVKLADILLCKVQNLPLSIRFLSASVPASRPVMARTMRIFSRIILCTCWLPLAPATLPAALSIQFDYTYDTANFFSGPNVDRRALLDAAANVFESRITSENFGAITPSGGNTWSLSFAHPTTGVTVTINNPVVPANTITIYPGARDLPGTLVGFAEYNYSFVGNASWFNQFQARNSSTNFDSFGGAIAFDPLAAWYFDTDVTTLESFPGQLDFFTTAQHEIAHLLGFITGANAYSTKISGATFTGAHAAALFGGPVPLSPDLGHFQEGLTFDGSELLMDPTFTSGLRAIAGELEFAVLSDIGYDVSPVSVPETTPVFVMLLIMTLTVVHKCVQHGAFRFRASEETRKD